MYPFFFAFLLDYAGAGLSLSLIVLPHLDEVFLQFS
jgi:hypothetical protein